MNPNDYKKVVHCIMWFDDLVLLSERIEEGDPFKGYWQDPGGKMEKGEIPSEAAFREVMEESGMEPWGAKFNFIDCFIFEDKKIKSFIFEMKYNKYHYSNVENREPDKQSDWKLFTKEEALKLKLMPSVRYYLENYGHRGNN